MRSKRPLQRRRRPDLTPLQPSAWLTVGTAAASATLGAIVVFVLLAWALGLSLHVSGSDAHAVEQRKVLIEAVKVSLAMAAALGAVVALALNYRRHRIDESQSHRDDQRLYTERFESASEQLGHGQPAVRLTGVHALARLADDWEEQRQMCIDVLCAYVRLPSTPARTATDGEPLAGNEQPERTPRAELEIRQTVIRIIAEHLRSRPEDPMRASWRGHDLDFTGVSFDGAFSFDAVTFSSANVSFNMATFRDGSVSFENATFDDGHVSFDNATFSGGRVSFDNATFDDGRVSFDDATFSGGRVSFDKATFDDGHLSFDEATFSGGRVSFNVTRLAGGQVSFLGATFLGDQVSFHEATFSGSEVSFAAAVFSGGHIIFDRATVHGGSLLFLGAEFLAGWVRFDSAKFSGGHVSFGVAKFSGANVDFKYAKLSAGEANFTDATFSGGQVNFERAEFSGSSVDFRRATFSGGYIYLEGVSDWSVPPKFDATEAPPSGVHLPAS